MKPHCLSFHLLFSTISILFITLALCRKTSPSQSSSHDCFKDMVYVDEPKPLSGCYLKVGLGRECTFTLQCSSLNANTYCGFNPILTGNQEVKVCLCDEGYSNSENPYECLPVRNCTGSAYFTNYDQADCGEWQFCRQGVCHCKADLAFNESGHCVPVEQGFKDEYSCLVSGQIFVKEPISRRGCYSSVELLEECQFSGQCSPSGGSNGTAAFCGWSPINTKNRICLCAEGYKPSRNSTKISNQCVPIKQCSLSGFNVGLEQANCGPEQFCRNNLCHCKPDYEYDPKKGECVKPIWDYGDGEDDDDGYFIEPQKPKKWYNKPAWIVFIVALLALIFFIGYAILLYHTRKEEDRLEQKNNRRGSGDENDDEYEEEENDEEFEVNQKLKELDDAENRKNFQKNIPLTQKMYLESEVL